MSPPAPRPRRALALGVLAAHIGLGIALHQGLRRPAPPPAVAAPRHVWVHLPAPDRPARHQPTPALDAAPAAPLKTVPRARAAIEPAPLAQPALQAITLPPAASPSPAAAEGPAPATVAASAPPPLNLALPARPASAPLPSSLARDDPRVQAAPLDGTQRMARALGTDTTLRTVRRGDGFELQRGNGCVQVQPSRAGQILPSDSSAPRPALVGRC